MAAAATIETVPRAVFPKSIGLWCTLFVLISVCQVYLNTDSTFILLVLVFNLLWIAGVYALGGFVTVTGASLGLFGIQHILYSQVAKILTWSRPDTPLLEPTETMLLYVVGMAGVTAAAFFVRSKPISRLKPILVEEIRVDRLKLLAIGFTFLMVVRYVGFAQFGRVLAVLSNFDFFTPVAVAASTAYVVISSDRKRCLGALTVIGMIIPLLSAIAFSQRKEASFAVIIFVITAYAYGFRFKLKHYLSGLAILYAFQFILFPYALYARSKLSGNDFMSNIGQAWEILQDVVANPRKYQEKTKEPPPISDYEATRLFYYGQPDPTSDRFSVLITTDALVRATDHIGPIGWQTIEAGLWMVVPRAFNPNKTQVGTSNFIAQRAPGVVGETDFKTSITLGFFSECYVAFKWMGILFIPFIVGVAFFGMYKVAIRDTLKNNFWACSMIVTLPWTFSEGTIQQLCLRVFQDAPLIAATGLVFAIAANSLSKKRNLQNEFAPAEGERFESKKLRMVG